LKKEHKIKSNSGKSDRESVRILDKKVNGLSKNLTKLEKKIQKIETLQGEISKYASKELTSVKSEDTSLERKIKNINDILQSTRKDLQDFKILTKKILESTAKSLKEETEAKIDKFTGKLEAKLKEIDEEIDTFNKKIIGLTEVLNENTLDIYERVDNLVSSASERKVDQKAFDEVMNSTNSRITQQMKLLENLRNELLVLLESFNNKIEVLNDDLNKKIQANIDLLDERFSANIIDLNSKLDSAVNKIENSMAEMKNDFNKRMRNLEDVTISKVDNLNDYVNNTLGAFKTSIESLEDRHSSGLFEINKRMDDFVSRVNSSIIETKDEMYTKLKNFENETIARIDDLTGHFNNIITPLAKTVDKVERIYFSLAESSKRFEDFIHESKANINDVRNILDQKIMSLWGENRAKIDDLSSDLSNWIANNQAKMENLNIRLEKTESKIKEISDKSNARENNLIEITNICSRLKDEIALMNGLIDKKAELQQKQIATLSQRVDELDEKLRKFLKETQTYSEKSFTVEKNVELLTNQYKNMEKQINELASLKELMSKLIETTREDINKLKGQIEMQERQKQLEEEAILKAISERMKR